MKQIEAAAVIERVCKATGYTRAYVANVMRRHAEALSATRRENGRWVLSSTAERKLKALVVKGAGPRYKCGEKGPNRREAA